MISHDAVVHSDETLAGLVTEINLHIRWRITTASVLGKYLQTCARHKRLPPMPVETVLPAHGQPGGTGSRK
jgi:hypothetical protein